MKNMSQFEAETALFAAASLPQAALRMPKQSLDPVWATWAAKLRRSAKQVVRVMRRNLTQQS